VDSLIGLQGSVYFQVYGNGVSLYRSPLMTAATPAQPISIKVKGIKTLRLVVMGGSSGTTYEDYADWALAALHA
jgi:beta-galactosidase